MTPCLICDGPTQEHARATIRQKYPAVFLRCQHCGFLFLPHPSWLAEAYAEAINRSDTGYVWRNLWARDKTRELVESFLNPSGPFLDYAAGYGLFVRLMRDAGYDFRWADLYCQNLFARGFEAPPPLTGPFEAVTAFEVFEHLPEPREELRKLSTLTDCLIFSTVLVPEPAPALPDWPYYSLEHGQHIAFYTRKSLEVLGNQFGYQLTTNGADLHLFSRKPVPPGIFSTPRNRWQRLAQRIQRRLTRKPPRTSLMFQDHDFIVKSLSEKEKG